MKKKEILERCLTELKRLDTYIHERGITGCLTEQNYLHQHVSTKKLLKVCLLLEKAHSSVYDYKVFKRTYDLFYVQEWPDGVKSIVYAEHDLPIISFSSKGLDQ